MLFLDTSTLLGWPADEEKLIPSVIFSPYTIPERFTLRRGSRLAAPTAHLKAALLSSLPLPTISGPDLE